MKKSIYKNGTLFATLLIILSSSLSAQEMEKKFHKQYVVEKGTILDLNNKYGTIVIETSETDEVIIDIQVTLRDPNKDRAERLLNYIDVDFSENDERISVSTVIDDKFSFKGWNSVSRRFSINYFVSMPVWLDLELVNRYGDTDLDDISGRVDIDIKYGNLTASNLNRGNEKPLNKITLAYGKGSIEKSDWLDLNLRYVNGFILNTNTALLLDSKYSKIQIGDVSSIVAVVKYDNIDIERLNNIVMDAGYTDIKIGTLSNKLEIEAGYGSLTVDEIPDGFQSLDIKSKYTGISMGIDREANYRLEANISYGGLKYNEDNFQLRKRIIENNSTEISGIAGKDPEPESTVRINSSYGAIRLY